MSCFNPIFIFITFFDLFIEFYLFIFTFRSGKGPSPKTLFASPFRPIKQIQDQAQKTTNEAAQCLLILPLE